MAVRVLVIDDDPLVHRTWRRLARSERLPLEILSATTATEAEELLEETGDSVDVVVLDYHLDPGCGLDVVPMIRRRAASAAVALVTCHLDTDVWIAATDLGVTPVPKSDLGPKRREVLLRLLRPQGWGVRRLFPELSDRETEVVELMMDGLTDKEIAGALGIAPSSIATYWHRIQTKTGLTRQRMRAAVTRQTLSRSA